jgi:hypothetical protein
MRDCQSSPISKKPVLTEEDVLTHLRAILQHGYGQVEIDIHDHYIRVIRPTPTILGRRP